MDLRLTDIEANAVKHALEKYLKVLEAPGGDKKGIEFEKKAVASALKKMQSLSGASGT